MKRKFVHTILFTLFFSLLPVGAFSMSNEIQQEPGSPSHFSSPEEAVPVITELLKNKDFKNLASYYDLTDSEIKLADLESGDFFIRRKRPEVGHPAGFWRYKHPFSPGFKYSSMSSASRENVHIIHLRIEIDQGAGSPPQMGMDSFYMIKSDNGWQILPGKVIEKESMAMPSTAPEPLPDPPWMKK